ncbi:HetZ-related protein 2 [Coleofasciculus sp. E2-BRE-01]|uniref:HetZ-related protein 2 n=1 Tax=Coleofasciculus sp. E2-BRE-01 TaxID=3069524 RepID=UPI0032FD8D2D
MQALKQGLEECHLMERLADQLEQEWQQRLANDYPGYCPTIRTSIVHWLLGENRERLNHLLPDKLKIVCQAMDYRYRILRQRYLGVTPEQAYRNLTSRLASLMTLRNKIRTWVSLSRDRQRAVVDVLQEVIQELLNSDRYIQGQIGWIAQCSEDIHLRDALLLTTLEEYCMRPIRNQPLVVYRFVNFLKRSGRGGMTHLPGGENVRFVSESITSDDTDAPVSLLDNQAIADYQETQGWQEQQALRLSVRQEFETYLDQNVGAQAAQWLRLYLQGKSQEEIAKTLGLPIQKVYRLREKISYHAIRVFSLKVKPELVASWLEVSLKEHNLGLTPVQWQDYWQSLTDQQRQLLQQLRTGKTLDVIAKDLNWKYNQALGEWSKLYLAAQDIRSSS